jgi:hypothetical protein
MCSWNCVLPDALCISRKSEGWGYVVCWGGSRFQAQGIYQFLWYHRHSLQRTAISCTWNKILLNKMNERGLRTRVRGCCTVQRSQYPLKVEIASLSDLITSPICGSHITKDILNMPKRCVWIAAGIQVGQLNNSLFAIKLKHLLCQRPALCASTCAKGSV